jgi:uncharacterized coiled-coil protein SlyX
VATDERNFADQQGATLEQRLDAQDRAILQLSSQVDRLVQQYEVIERGYLELRAELRRVVEFNKRLWRDFGG